MRGDPFRAGAHRKLRGPHWARMIAASRISDRRDMVDVDA
jgi:hypothetical protein